MAGVAAGEPRHVPGDRPHIAERPGEGSEMVHAVGGGKHPLPVDRPVGRLEGVGAAEARRADRRAARMGADGGRDGGRADRGGGTARRAARGAARVMRVAGARRTAAAEGDCHRLAEDRRAAFPERVHDRRILLRAVTGEQRRAVFGRHVGGLDQVLDPDRQPVDRRQRRARPVARARRVRRLPRAVEIDMGPGHDLVLARLDFPDAALEKIARRVRAVAESGHAVVEGDERMRLRVVACHPVRLSHAKGSAAPSGSGALKAFSVIATMV